MVAGDITNEDGVTWYRYRGKGNKQGKRELPEPAYTAITAALSGIRAGHRDHVPGCVVVAVPACTSFGTQPPSSAATLVSRLRTSPASSTTRRCK